MPGDKKPSHPAREQTDESLRVEREKADQALEEDGAAIDDTADAVISRARQRADDVLDATRARADLSAPEGAPALSPALLKDERSREDQVLQAERAVADGILREERAEHIALLAKEREETDRDLSNERARSDLAVATRDDFLGIVSHDLRNLLNAMVGFAALIVTAESRENHGEQVLHYAGRIQRSGRRMHRLVGDLVDVASMEAGMLKVTREVSDPTLVVTEAVETFHGQASAAGVSLTAEIAPPSASVSFDSARILQVLCNLISNAIKFTAEGGTVVIHLEQCGDEIRFAVRDTGVGIPGDKLEAVFVRFLQVTRDDRRGVGLGLYISKAIVQGHGGRIWAESRVGEGSAFFFTLPVETA